MRYEEYLKQIMDDFCEESVIKPEAFPAMDLYADQVAGFLSDRLRVYAGAGRGEAEPVITKAGIANSIKRGALPRPVKKKYTRDHVVIMAMLFYMKNAFQMSEMERVMRPFTDNHASAFDDKIDFHRLYAAIAPVLEKERERLSREIRSGVADVKAAIRGAGLEDDDNTELLFLFLSLAARADTARYAARELLREYFAEPAGSEKKKSAGKPAGPEKNSLHKNKS
jgi:hypothetical protein